MTLYTMDNCPWCVVLKKRLDFAKVAYKEIDDMDIIEEKGFPTVPRLDIGSEILDFPRAIAWVNDFAGGRA